MEIDSQTISHLLSISYRFRSGRSNSSYLGIAVSEKRLSRSVTVPRRMWAICLFLRNGGEIGYVVVQAKSVSSRPSPFGT